MRAIAQTIRFIAKAQIWLASIVIIIMVSHVCLEVASRAIIGRPIAGTIEAVSYWYMIMAAFLPLAFVQLTNQNIRVDLLSNLLPPLGQRLVDLFANVFTLGVVAVMGYASLLLGLRQTGYKEAVRAATFDFPVWPMRWIVIVSVMILGFVLLAQLLYLIGGRLRCKLDDFRPEANNIIGPVE